MNDKSSENRAQWPLYSQSFYYSFALDINDLLSYPFSFILVKVLNKKGNRISTAKVYNEGVNI